MLVAATLSLAAPARAARPGLRHYTAEDGLPQAQVTAIAQDADGYLWVGTLAGGLARYNGHRWDRFDTSSGLPSESVTALAAGPGGVYVATSSGLVRRDAERWTPIAFAGAEKLVVVALLPLAPDELWIGTSAGLFLWKGQGPAVRPFGDDPVGLPAVDALVSAPDGSLWIGGRVLRRVVRGTPPRLEKVAGVPAGRVWHVALLPDGEPVVSLADAGVFRRHAGAWTRIGDDRAPGRRVVTLLADAVETGTIWMGSDDLGAFAWRGDAVETFAKNQGLPDVHVNALAQDREGLLWFGTDNGLVKRGPSAFVTWDEADGLPEESTVFGLTQDAQGALWMAAYDDGVLRRSPDGRVRQFTVADGLPAQRVLDVVADGAGVWVATSRGLARIEGDAVKTPSLANLPRMVFTMQPVPGGLAVGGAGGLSIVRPSGVQRVEGIPDDVSTIAVAPDGTIWCGGAGWGLGPIRDGRLAERLTTAQGLPSNQVTSARFDSAGGLWVATEQGAWHRAADGRTTVVDRRSGLPDAYVYWVGEDRNGGVWFGTNKGAAHRARGQQALTVYTTRDGLGSDECNDDGFFVDRNGTVYVSSVGVSVFTGAVQPRRSVEPLVRVEQFTAGGHRGADAIGPSPGPVTFQFAALSYTDEHAVRFRYRLVGADEEWRDGSPGQRETTYAGLGPGDYRFEVVAVTGDGRTSQAATVPFRVKPRWWQTRSAAVVGLALAALAVFAVIRVRERRLVAARLRLEALVEERTRELRRVNERLEDLAVTDELTGISNRRRLTEGLNSRLALARRQKTPLSVAIADLDRFKELNDTEGHGAGDRALVRSADALRQALREVDLLGRWGGEEFLIVLPNTDLAGAREAGERLRRAIEQMELRNQTTGRLLTVSIGVAEFTEGVESSTELVRRADQALYKAKAGGRNQVVAFEPEPAERTA